MARLQAFCTIILLAAAIGHAHADTYEKEMSTLAQNVADAVVKGERKKVSVLDFSDLQGNVSELGRFLAEELSVNLVMGASEKKSFAVVDRANLKRLLAEHKLTAEGLVNPENAKKLGQFSGVDAIILGNTTVVNDVVVVTVKVIATDTAEIVGAARMRITKSKEIEQLIGNAVAEAPKEGVKETGKTTVAKEPPAAPLSHKFENYIASVSAFQLSKDGVALVTLDIKNTSEKGSVHFGVNEFSDVGPDLISCKMIDEKANVLRCVRIEGMQVIKNGYSETSSFKRIKAGRDTEWREQLTELNAGQTLRCTLTFASPQQDSRRGGGAGGTGGVPALGESFTLQLEIIRVVGDENGPPKLDNVYIEKLTPKR